MIICKRCKTKNKEGSKFCKKCGRRFTKNIKKQLVTKRIINVEQQSMPETVQKEVFKQRKIEGGFLIYKNEKLGFLVLVRISLILIFGLAGIILLLNGKLESLIYLFISLIWTPIFSIKSKSLDKKPKIFISFMLLLLISPFQYGNFSTIFVGFIFLVFIAYIIKALKSRK
jgi:RNA polymerase subunit RPABC4/transcription elongation factor Spt4